MVDNSMDEVADIAGLDILATLLPLTEGARRLYFTGHYSDLTITCNERSWNVHKFQLCSQSEFFHNACSGKFQEAQDNTINLDADEPEAVDAMIYYLYHFDHTDSGTKSALVLDVRVFAIADKYLLEPLKQLAARKFEAHCKAEWQTAAFAEAAAEAYATAPVHDNTLKRTVVATVKAHAVELRSAKPEYEAFRKVISEIAELGADLVFDGAMGESSSTGAAGLSSSSFTWYRCPQPFCGLEFYRRDGQVPPTAYCPNGCFHDRPPVWWAPYKIDAPQ